MKLKEKHFDSIDSTQKWTKENFKQIDHHTLVCVTADEQTRGVGRFGRPWHSPKEKNIYATFAFSLPKTALHLISLAQLMTLSFARVLLSEKLDPKIKWPNDVLINDKKLAGVLCETSFTNNHVDIYLGIGINVNMSLEECKKIDKPATSLRVETGKEWSTKDLLQKLQKKFQEDLEIFQKEGFTSFLPRFNNLMAYIGQEVSCYDGKQQIKGICHSLTNDGQLNLCMPDGSLKTVLSGDLTCL